MAEQDTNSALLMDRGIPIANDLDADGRRKLRIGSGEYALKVDDQGTFLYLGQAAPGSLGSQSVWLIQKIEYTSTQVDILFANGSSEFNSIWDNRASLTYV